MGLLPGVVSVYGVQNFLSLTPRYQQVVVNRLLHLNPLMNVGPINEQMHQDASLHLLQTLPPTLHQSLRQPLHLRPWNPWCR